MAYDILHVPSARLRIVQHHPTPRWRIQADHWHGPIRQPLWTLDYCGWEGMTCTVAVEGRQGQPFRRPPGTWHFYAPGVAYRERYDRPAAVSGDMWLQFELSGKFPPLSTRRFAALFDPEERIAPHVRTLHALQERGEPGTELLAHGHFLAVLGELRAAALRGGAGTPGDPWRVRGPESSLAAGRAGLAARVDAAVSRRLDDPPALDALAAGLNLSVSSLAHRFKAETGLTVVERIRWLRVREARRRLALPGATVKATARELGFSSAFYFSRVFTEVTGVAPMAYLRRQRGR